MSSGTLAVIPAPLYSLLEHNEDSGQVAHVFSALWPQIAQALASLEATHLAEKPHKNLLPPSDESARDDETEITFSFPVARPRPKSRPRDRSSYPRSHMHHPRHTSAAAPP